MSKNFCDCKGDVCKGHICNLAGFEIKGEEDPNMGLEIAGSKCFIEKPDSWYEKLYEHMKTHGIRPTEPDEGSNGMICIVSPDGERVDYTWDEFQGVCRDMSTEIAAAVITETVPRASFLVENPKPKTAIYTTPNGTDYYYKGVQNGFSINRHRESTHSESTNTTTNGETNEDTI